MASADLARIDEEALASWLLEQRWFASKARELASVHVLDVVDLVGGRSASPRVAVALVEARFPGGTHDIYQLPVVLAPIGTGARGRGRKAVDAGMVAEVAGLGIRDAVADPDAAAALARLLRERAEVQGARARVSFRWLEALAPPRELPDVRPVGAEQSNSSVVFDDAFVLKVLRRVEAGDNPELEMVRFLSDHGFAHVPELGGWYEYAGELMDATLGIAQRFLPDARNGWELALDELGSDLLIARLWELGDVIGSMHSVLGSDGSDPAFAPEEPTDETLALLTATIDEEIERAFLELPADEPAVADIVGRGEEVRDRLRLLSRVGAQGRLIRQHGDLHLGQTMMTGEGWMVFDFEGEPARPLLERRRKRSPLRDVAGMLRSLAYVASASELQRGVAPPEGWEGRAREAFLGGYLGAVDPALLPPGEGPLHTLLSIFELEKAVYELRYELNNRPDWVSIPAAGIRRLLEQPVS